MVCFVRTASTSAQERRVYRSSYTCCQARIVYLSNEIPEPRRLVNIEERGQAGRGVSSAGGSAAPEDHDDANDEQAHERAAEAGGKRHGQRRCVTYHRPTTGIESHSVWATVCVSAWVCGRGCTDTFGLAFRRRIRSGSHLGPFPLRPVTTLARSHLHRSHLGPFPLGPVPAYMRRLLSVRPVGGACGHSPQRQQQRERPIEAASTRRVPSEYPMRR